MTQPNYHAQELTVEQCDKAIALLTEKLRFYKLRRKSLVSSAIMKRNMQDPEFKANWAKKTAEIYKDPVRYAAWRKKFENRKCPRFLPPMTAAQREHYYRLRSLHKKMTREEAIAIAKSVPPLPSAGPAPAAVHTAASPHGGGGTL